MVLCGYFNRMMYFEVLMQYDGSLRFTKCISGRTGLQFSCFSNQKLSTVTRMERNSIHQNSIRFATGLEDC